MILFFDTETTGLPENWKAPVTDINNWPRMVQLAYLLYDNNGNKIKGGDYIIKPNGFSIPVEASQIYGITNERALSAGVEIGDVLKVFDKLLEQADFVVAHNMSFDEKIIGAEFVRRNLENNLAQKNKICTMLAATDFCAIPGNYGYKWPKLSELHYKLFNSNFEEAHNAAIDIDATAKCFWELIKRGVLDVPNAKIKNSPVDTILYNKLWNQEDFDLFFDMPFRLANDQSKTFIDFLTLCFITHANRLVGSKVSVEREENFKLFEDSDIYKDFVVPYSNELISRLKNNDRVAVLKEIRWLNNLSNEDIKKYLFLDVSKGDESELFKNFKEIIGNIIEYIDLESQKEANARRLVNVLTTASQERANNNKGGCYIATLVYGDYDHPQVVHLRHFRDSTLSATLLGRFFIKFYYSVSPTIVKLFKRNILFIKFSRKCLDVFINQILKYHD
jgi:DNA polymerase III epsilon subunit-like protein